MVFDVAYCCSWLHRLELRQAQEKDGSSGH